MATHQFTIEQMKQFRAYLNAEDRSAGTVEKYLRDVQAFSDWMEKEEVTHERAAAWRENLSSPPNESIQPYISEASGSILQGT